MRFKDLNVGDTFDFIAPEEECRRRGFGNSCFDRYEKASARKYFWNDPDGRIFTAVGTVNVEVFNVTRIPPTRD